MTINERTLDSYLNALRRIFVVEDVPAWSPSLRSRTTIRTSDKRQLVDPSIATGIMRIDAGRVIRDLETFGFLFESLCTRDIRIYAQVNEAAENLIELKNKVDTSRIGEPSFMMVLTGGRYAYKRPDGVLVVPLGCLKD